MFLTFVDFSFYFFYKDGAFEKFSMQYTEKWMENQ